MPYSYVAVFHCSLKGWLVKGPGSEKGRGEITTKDEAALKVMAVQWPAVFPGEVSGGPWPPPFIPSGCLMLVQAQAGCHLRCLQEAAAFPLWSFTLPSVT